MIFHFSVLVILLCGFWPVGDDPDVLGDAGLSEVLRDAQATNLAALRSGTLRARVEFRPEDGVGQTILKSYVAWHEDNVFWKYLLDDPNEPLSSATPKNQSQSARSWEYKLQRDGRLYSYNAAYNALYIRKMEAKSLHNIFSLTPRTMWFRCCPPNVNDGRPWMEMIGVNQQFPTKDVVSYEIRSEGDGIIRQRRLDRNGGVLDINFSMKLGGNVVRFDYSGAAPTARSRHGEYEWEKRTDSAFVLKKCEFVQSMPGKPKSVGNHYKLEITDATVGRPADYTVLTVDGFCKLLPRDVSIYDDTIVRSNKRTPSDVNMEGLLRDFSAILKTRGFLKGR